MKKQWSANAWMAIGITAGVIFGGILWMVFDKPATLVVIGYPFGLALGIILKNRFAKPQKFGANLTTEQRRTQMVMIVVISILVVIGMLIVSYLAK